MYLSGMDIKTENLMVVEKITDKYDYNSARITYICKKL